MNRRQALLLSVLAITLLAMSTVAWADGFVVISDPSTVVRVPGHFEFAPLGVTYHRVTVDINDQVATTTVEQEFHNPSSQRLEGTYMFPLPAGAHVDKFSMDVNGTMTQAELLDAGKARSIYEDIVRKYRDPALLEYAGRDAFKARIFPIEPNSRKQIRITYTQVLKSDSSAIEYTYPLNTEKFSSRPLESVSVKVNLTCTDAIKSLYSPSHNVEVRRDGASKATMGYEERNVRPDTDFKLIFSRNTSPVGIDLLTYRNTPDDGYFLLLASPGFETVAADKIERRDVCFVVDTSGSMAEAGGKKMEQAKRALSFCLQNLNPGDRFEIVRFSTEAEGLFGEMTNVRKESIAKAQEYVQSLKPIGGTAISDALQKALSVKRIPDGKIFDKDPLVGRPFVIIFLTDGQPTIGDTNEDSLVGAVTKANLGSTRIFSFGIGTDVNTHLLDRIAQQTKAFSQYVLPQEDLEVKLSSFYTKISQPVLSNVALTFSGADIKTTQLYPSAMPDLFRGENVIAFGRYKGKGPAAAKITGTLNGQPREFVTDVNFAEHDMSKPFIPQLWATRRVGWLLDEIRMHGESAELKDEVTRLAREHGIVTPYTSYLIVEDERRRGVPVAMQTQRELAADREVSRGAAAKYASANAEAAAPAARAGTSAVENAQDLEELKSATNVQQQQAQGQRLRKNDTLAGRYDVAAKAPAETQPGGYKRTQNYAQQARVVNGRAFYQNGNTWTDATAQTKKSLKQQQVAFNSTDYFAMLSKHPDAAQWLALGSEVDLVLEDTLYQIR